MNRDIMDGRMERELRRRQLAVRLISHQARTQIIEELTGLTRHQLETFRRRAGVATNSRFRGPAPTSFEVFFSSTRMRSESAVLAFLYLALGASKFGKRNGSSESAIHRGERLCEVYELWQHLFPNSPMEFDQLILLGEGVSRGDQISFAYCEKCRAILLVDLLGGHRRLCIQCARTRRKNAESGHSGTNQGDNETELALYGLQLLGGQLLRERKGTYALDDGAADSDQVETR